MVISPLLSGRNNHFRPACTDSAVSSGNVRSSIPFETAGGARRLYLDAAKFVFERDTMRAKLFDRGTIPVPLDRAGLFVIREMLLVLICLACLFLLVPHILNWSVPEADELARLRLGVSQKGVARISALDDGNSLYILRPKQRIYQVNLTTGAIERTLPLLDGEISEIKHSRDGLTSLVFGCDGFAELYYCDYCGEPSQYISLPAAVGACTIPIAAGMASDGSLALVFMENGLVQGWVREDTSFQSTAYQLPLQADLTQASLDPSGERLFVAQANGMQAIHDAQNGRLKLSCPQSSCRCTESIWSADGGWIVAGHEDGTISILDSSSGNPVSRFEMPIRTIHDDTRILSIAVSPDRRYLAATSDRSKEITLWDMNSSNSPRQLAGHAGLVRTMAFSHNSERLYSGSLDGTIREWSTEAGAQLRFIE
jgi:WD40 repeat protein